MMLKLVLFRHVVWIVATFLVLLRRLVTKVRPMGLDLLNQLLQNSLEHRLRMDVKNRRLSFWLFAVVRFLQAMLTYCDSSQGNESGPCENSVVRATAAIAQASVRHC